MSHVTCGGLSYTLVQHCHRVSCHMMLNVNSSSWMHPTWAVHWWVFVLSFSNSSWIATVPFGPTIRSLFRNFVIAFFKIGSLKAHTDAILYVHTYFYASGSGSGWASSSSMLGGRRVHCTSPKQHLIFKQLLLKSTSISPPRLPSTKAHAPAIWSRLKSASCPIFILGAQKG
jgi:hypothetical protein